MKIIIFRRIFRSSSTVINKILRGDKIVSGRLVFFGTLKFKKWKVSQDSLWLKQSKMK